MPNIHILEADNRNLCIKTDLDVRIIKTVSNLLNTGGIVLTENSKTAYKILLFFLHCTTHHTIFVLGSSSSELCFLFCIGPETLFVWELMLTISSSSMWSQGSLSLSLATALLSSLTEMSHYIAWIHGTMERLANPLISLYALFTEWGFSSCRHREPILDSYGCQRAEEKREREGGAM